MINRVWHLLVVLVLLAAVVAVAHLLPGLDDSFVDVDIRNSLHIVGFAGVAAIVFELVPLSLAWKSLSALVFAITLGFLAETLQRHTASGFNGMDIARDAAGAGVYVLARLVWSRSENQESGNGRRIDHSSLRSACWFSAAGALLFVACNAEVLSATPAGDS